MILGDYYKTYEREANKIRGWKTISKNDLCNLYIEHEHDKLSESYFSAIVAKYWSLIGKYYSSSKYGVSEEDCYTWLIESILYAIENRVWKDPNSKLYNDPNGPDKAINIKMKCSRLTHYQLLNKDKRSSNLGVISIEELEEELGDTATEYLGATTDPEFSYVKSVVEDMITGCVSSYDYFTAVLLDLIVYNDVLDYSNGKEGDLTNLNKRKVVKIIKSFDENYFDGFQKSYSIESNLMTDMKKYFSSLSSEKIYELIDRSLSMLRNSKMRNLIKK